jgi:hypothetical protein
MRPKLLTNLRQNPTLSFPGAGALGAAGQVPGGRQVRHLPADGVRACAHARRVARGDDRVVGQVAVAGAGGHGGAPRRHHDVLGEAARRGCDERHRPADDAFTAHGRQDEPATDVSGAARRLAGRAGAGAGAFWFRQRVRPALDRGVDRGAIAPPPPSQMTSPVTPRSCSSSCCCC